MTKRRAQVVGYVLQEIKADLNAILEANQHVRLSESTLIERALIVAMPTLRQEFLPKPERGKKVKAA